MIVFGEDNFKKMPDEVLNPCDDEYQKLIENKKNNFDKKGN